MFASCADPKSLEGLAWLMCYLTSGKHLLFYASFGTVLLLLAVTAPAALLMGFGGVLALGCSIGQGLSGFSTLSLGSLVALAGIVAGAFVALSLIPQPTPAGATT